MASTTACCPHHGRLEGQPTTAWHSLGGTKRKRKSENNVTPQSRRMSKWTGINTGHRHRSSVRPNWSQSQPCSRNGGNDSCRHDTVLYKGSGREKTPKKKRFGKCHNRIFSTHLLSLSFFSSVLRWSGRSALFLTGIVDIDAAPWRAASAHAYIWRE